MKKITLVKIALMASFFSWLIGCSNSILEPQGLEPTSSWQLPKKYGSVNISPDGQLLAVSKGAAELRVIDGVQYGGKTKLDIRNTQDGSLIKTLDAFAVSNVAFSQDNYLIAVGSYHGDITIYRLETGEILHSITVPKKDPQLCIKLKHNKPCQVGLIAFSLDGQYLVSRTGRQGTDVWDVASGSQLYRIEKEKGLTISQNSQFIAFFGKPIAIHQLSDGKLVRQLKQEGRVKFSPDGKLIAIAKNRNISLYNLENNTVQQELMIFLQSVLSWEFSPDGKYLAVAGYTPSLGGGSIHIGDNRSKPIRRSSSELAIYRLDDLSKQTLSIQQASTIFNYGKLSFSEDGQTFVVAGLQGNVYLWDISDF